MKRGTDLKLKFRLLQRQLGLSLWETKGLLQSLWDFTAENAQRGDIGRFTNDDIAIGIEWDRCAADLLLVALVRCRWVDESPEHRLVIHNWHVHCESWIAKRVERAGMSMVTGAMGRQGSRGTVYLLQEDGYIGVVKVGFTAMSMEARLEGLQSGNPNPLSVIASIPANKGAESNIKKRLAAYIVKGEWFRVCDASIRILRTYFGSIPDDFGSGTEAGGLPGPEPGPGPGPEPVPGPEPKSGADAPTPKGSKGQLALLDTDPIEAAAYLDAERLVPLIMQYGAEWTRADRIEWLHKNIPLIVCDVQKLGDEVVGTARQAMAHFRSTMIRYFRADTGERLSNPNRKPPESFDKAQIRESEEWLDRLRRRAS